jgi:hypothetical protein
MWDFYLRCRSSKTLKNNTYFKKINSQCKSLSSHIVKINGDDTPKKMHLKILSAYFCSLLTHNWCKRYKINPHLAVVSHSLWWKCNCVETADKYQL